MCSNCMMVLRPRGDYEVSGASADEVVKVVRELERRRRPPDRSPWRAGLFYLVCLISVAVLFMAVGRLVPIWAVPAVLVASLVGVLILGALQQRQDGKLTEHGFLDLIQAALRTAGTIGPAGPGEVAEEPARGSTPT
jgi:Flp pilus assembly protein TadB